ncbi:thioester reductase domain-containing protein [Geodermatophilus sp. DSM 44513]|uniref:thioester reductase domain-containing protein n=1 Tax=Geodermatophilus sp. DSM 44513 TaxID=1528104 RepID=UPI0012753484|nr:thioester reductase domain-containing protein [Geodermatophilus sp. DSM 44513]WNV75185.1 thioester reductase domain-containing protein [Geodermatophilus sp. DSM 44513]
MRLKSTMMSAFDHFAERPALAERRPIPSTSEEIRRKDGRVLDAYETLTYSALGKRVGSVAAQLQGETREHEDHSSIRPGDRVALLGFASIDFTTVDFACNLAGITTVPLQTSGTHEQQSAIITETEPRALAATVALLERAARLLASHPTVERLIILDYRGGEPEHRRAVEALAQQISISPETLDIENGEYVSGLTHNGKDDDLAMLMYTSGSTGTPKGAMYTERLVAEMWGGEGWSEFFAEETDIANFHYMPMSHVAGHSSVRSTLARGGVTYFASTTNLSSFFEDLSLARPTELSLVPRVCELLHQEYQRRLHATATPSGSTAVDSKADAAGVLAEMRKGILGGNVQWASCTSAPVSAELKNFIESLLGIELHELYGTTEIGGVLADGRFLSPPVIDYKLQDVPELGYFTSDRPDARGELLVKSTSTVPGYFSQPELNREIFTDDGYYRTGDIAAVDSDGRVRIIDRKNAIIKLSQGEFVALPSLEATYIAGSKSIRQTFLYGQSDESSIVGVAVPSDQLRTELADDVAAIQTRILHEFRKVAADESLNSYEIPSAVLVEFEPFSESNGLLSDHRKLVRPRLTEKYGPRLATLYQQLQSGRDELLDWLRSHGAEEETVTTLRRAIAVSLQSDPEDIAETAKFRNLGGDSLTAVYLSRLLEQIYGIRVSVDTVASESYDIRDLAEYIDAKRLSGRDSASFEEIHGTDPQRLHATDLTLPRFMKDDLAAPGSSEAPQAAKSVLITGASGYLGRFLCLEWLRKFEGTDHRVACLIRASNDAAARDRLRKAFSTSDSLLAEFDELSANLDVIAGDLSEARLGLDDQTWERLAGDLTEIVHAGAMVNHALPYRELFAANVSGTAEVIRLAVTDSLKPMTFMSSIATALLTGASSPLDELSDIRRALPEVQATGGIVDGYATTKWAGEALLRDAHERYGLPVTVFRASMILAHSSYRGQINVPDTFTRLLYSLVRTGLAPSSFYSHDGDRAHYDGLPVDVVAQAITAVTLRRQRETLATYHLVNPFDDGVSLDRMVKWLIDMGVPLTRIESYGDWMHRFAAALNAFDEDDKRASVLPLLDGLSRPEEPSYGSLIGSSEFAAALSATGSRVTVSSLTSAFLMKCVEDLEYVFGQPILHDSLATTR